jgi:hypothetical protein
MERDINTGGNLSGFLEPTAFTGSWYFTSKKDMVYTEMVWILLKNSEQDGWMDENLYHDLLVEYR